ncbi:MAG: cytochrome c nitrite reductase small subunit [Candidatus Krumholzibacteria bacterium]|nr:cytochrome c nitrite reductase small subunit [Candidatus Krumholzibacteria bacterium]
MRRGAPQKILAVRLSAAMLGVFAGVSLSTFWYAQGTSYLFDDPATCMNCHVMRDQFDAWNRSSHARSAVCNDCHTPKDFIGKYAVKGINGWHHGSAFTTGGFHEPIRIRPFNREVVIENCVRCHADLSSRMRAFARGDRIDCTQCHRGTGHEPRR